MERNLQDRVTHALKSALDSLFLNHPARTTAGILLGIGIDIASTLLTPLLAEAKYIDFSLLEIWHFILLGIFLTQLPAIVGYLVRRPVLDENTEMAFSLIKEARKQGVSEVMIRQLYIRICEKALEGAVLNQETRESVRALERAIVEKDHQSTIT